MIGVEKVKGESCFWTSKRRGVPVHMEELTVTFVGHVTRTTPTKSDLHFMPTVDVNDGELMVGGVRRTRITTMPEVADISE